MVTDMTWKFNIVQIFLGKWKNHIERERKGESICFSKMSLPNNIHTFLMAPDASGKFIMAQQIIPGITKERGRVFIMSFESHQPINQPGNKLTTVLSMVK